MAKGGREVKMWTEGKAEALMVVVEMEAAISEATSSAVQLIEVFEHNPRGKLPVFQCSL